MLGSLDKLPEIVERLGIERVVIAFTRESHDTLLDLIRSLRGLPVYVDLVPRLFEAFHPSLYVHTVEGIPLIGLTPARYSSVAMMAKRALDIIGASIGLLLTAPLLAYITLRIKFDSPGPVIFRQERLGMHMREFTLLKFRTMSVDTDDAPHREYIKQIMAPAATVGSNQLYKLERRDAVTKVGAWLRRLSLDELPQLWNVLRGEMSLVGPRPCLAYELENFAPHHFERFAVPAGLTGLWQTSARANATFVEALEMDVAYARGWSLALDLSLLCRTPFLIARGNATA
jgi:lipopolysaccharide/colanic/teichoic acid biosynthesis glycosyltransferase